MGLEPNQKDHDHNFLNSLISSLDELKIYFQQNQISKKAQKDLYDYQPFPPSAFNLAPSISPPATWNALNQYIDHTLLKPEATEKDIEKLCQEALQYRFKAVCLAPAFLPLAKQILSKSSTLLCTVVGFPLGSTLSVVKKFEAQEAAAQGAEEIDMVLNLGALKSKLYATVLTDIESVVSVVPKIPVKVILETSLLNEKEKIMACLLSKLGGAHFVKTSTGFSSSGAKAEDIYLMRKIVGPSMGVKASGGIKTLEDAQKMLGHGANRLGTSSGIFLMEELKKLGPSL